MIKSNKISAAVVLSTSVLLSACGGGGGGGSASSTNDSNEKSSSGPITSFGSVYVNGKRYDTSGADVYVEDSKSSESELRVGMMVDVYEDANGNAASVHYDDDLEGIVTKNNIATGSTTGTIEIMGQTVTVDSKTIFESKVPTIGTVDLIVAGNIVEVSGYITSNSTITATRLEVKATDLTAYLSEHHEGVEVKGLVAEHSAGDKTFKMGTLVVNYAGAILDDLPSGIQDNLYVEVKSIQGLNASDELVASKVELEDHGKRDHHGDDGDEHEVKGYVTALSADSITVNEQTFIIDSNTEYEDNAKASVKVGVMVEVEGYVNAAGKLVAHEIELEHDSYDNEIKGTVATVTNSADNNGTITLVGGTVIVVNDKTLMHDERDYGFTPDVTFNLADIKVGDYIEVYVVDNGDSTFTAIKIEREDTP